MWHSDESTLPNFQMKKGKLEPKPEPIYIYIFE